MRRLVELNSSLSWPLKDWIANMNYLNETLYAQARQFSCCATQDKKRKAKEEVLQAYEIIEKVISTENYSLEAQEIDLFKVKSHHVRNFLILLVGGFVVFSVFVALLMFAPYIIPALGLPMGAAATAVASGAEILASASIFFGMIMGEFGGITMMMTSIVPLSNNWEFEKFKTTVTEKLPRFFGESYEKLVPNVASKRTLGTL